MNDVIAYYAIMIIANVWIASSVIAPPERKFAPLLLGSLWLACGVIIGVVKGVM